MLHNLEYINVWMVFNSAALFSITHSHRYPDVPVSSSAGAHNPCLTEKDITPLHAVPHPHTITHCIFRKNSMEIPIKLMTEGVAGGVGERYCRGEGEKGLLNCKNK